MKLSHLLILFLLLGMTHESMAQKQGRRGNALYGQEQYEAAADAYYSGLETYQEGKPDAGFYGMQNNLGAALHQQEEFQMAEAAFANALEAATTAADVARTAYNAGNNAFKSEQAEAALEHYKKALLADPTNQNAKFNYEFVKRQLEEQQQQQQQNQENQDQNEENQDEQQDQQNQDQQQDQQNEDEQQDQQNQDQQEQQQNEDQQQQQQQPEPSEQLSQQQAERILQALENEEEQLLREVQKVKGRPRRVEKDW